MGLRAASVRHSNAVVMAPALTETNQAQSFTLPPSSPINANHINDYEITRDGTVYNGVTKCPTVYLDCLKLSKRKASKQPLNIIMSEGPTPMGDQEDTMGLQKAGMDAVASLLKDKTISNDVEQLLNNLDSDMPGADMGGGADISQNVDELMQVIKNMEVNSSDRVEDVTASEISSQNPSETVIFPFDRVFDQVLFNNVDMISNFDEEQLSGSTSKESRAKETIEELNRKQLKLERRSEFLLRRLRKIQARAIGQHVSGEVVGLLECIHRTLRRVKETNIEGNEELVKVDEPITPVSSNTLKNLVKKLEVSSMIQSNSSVKTKSSLRYFGSGSVDHNARNLGSGSVVVPKLNQHTRQELEKVSGMLQTEMKIVEKHIDSDATASSSGGESCDEMQTYNNPHQQFLATSKRAAWRWAQERAAVASRWTWLQAQISDLEYRIRQHNELHRQIRACKGAVSLAAVSELTTLVVTGQEAVSPSAVNGYRGQLPGNSGNKEETMTHNGSLPDNSPPYSARTRPFSKSNFRKRKLIQTTGLHALSKKAGRPSNIRCGCVEPMTPCALCTGRADPTFPRDMPEQMTIPERVALLDPGYHPVLSFPEDVPQSIHLEAIMKLPEWQQRSNRFNMKQMKGLTKLERVDKTGLDLRPKKSEHRRKYSRLIKNNSTLTSTDLKHKISRGRKAFSRSTSLSRMKKRAKVAMSQSQQPGGESLDEEADSLAGGIGGSAPGSPSPHLVSALPYRRNRVDSYDIDNIVIPYSVAASTRVERLQYKEILTPKWRVVDVDFPSKYDIKNNGIVRRNSQDSDVEDVTDEMIAVRHEKCEHDERKKFLSYIKFPLSQGRSRANRRTDSRAESSGANTPDPMSPHAETQMDTGISPIISPPATPINITEEAHRRRTISNSRWAREREECTSMIQEVKEVPPYDLRNFPLTNETYDKMLKNMPDGHPLPYYLQKSESDPMSPFVESVCSPISDSTESAMAEDPNDPEWIDVERIKDRTKR